MYATHWDGLLSPFWEHKWDLQHHRLHTLRYWSGTTSQHRQTNRLCRQIRIGAAHHELSRSRGDFYLAPGYRLVPHTLSLRRFISSTRPVGEHLWRKACNVLWWLGKVTHHTSTDNSSADSYIVPFLDDLGPNKIDLLPSFYTT